MKIRFVKSKVILLGVFAVLFFSFYINAPNVLASNNVTENQKLEIISQDGQDIDIRNMAPGNTNTKNYIIKNKSSTSTDVFVELKKINVSKSDLFNQLILTINYDGQQIYHGVISSFKTTKLSQIPGNSEKTLEITQHLPGEETENEFQNSTLETEFIFRTEGASSGFPIKGNNILPKTGSEGFTVFRTLGSGFIMLGFILRNKRKWV